VLENKKKLLTGSEIVVQACLDAEAGVMYGYPITPTCEILSGWIATGKPSLQTEDEIAAGFAVCGAVLAGQKAFTASGGPGHVLLQDGMSMAEGMRLPFVIIVGQRGGPSSGTVIYSQQEVMLACFGGNGEGLRLVYSPATSKELYELTRQAFNDAWQYRFPAIVLTDGYLLKMKSGVDLSSLKIENISAHPLVPEDKIVHWPNIYTMEEELNEQIGLAQKDWEEISPLIAKAEILETTDVEVLLIAHGIVGSAVKEAVKQLRKNGIKAGYFRPITLRPFPKKDLDKVCGWESVKKVVVVESSAGQLARIVRDQLAPEIAVSFEYLQKPGLGIEVEEVINLFK